MEYKDFKFYVGETISYCQTIENDVKWIYSAMRKGDMDKNFAYIARWTLGKTINELEKLDSTDGDNFLADDDYGLLHAIKDERDYLAHKIFREFLYKNNFERSQEYARACSRLMNFHNRIERLWKSVETAKLNAIKVYRKNN